MRQLVDGFTLIWIKIIIPTVRDSNPGLNVVGGFANLDAPGGELDADGRLGFQVELIPGEPRQQIALADAGIADQNDWKRIISV